MSLLIEIPGEPVAMGRPRSVPIRRKDGSMGVRVYQPKKGTTWKKTAHDHMLASIRERPYIPEGPIRLIVWAIFTCPKSDHRKTMEVPARWRGKMPDGDNVLKAVKDAAKGVLWLDDNQVADARIMTITAGQHQAPRVIFEVEKLLDRPQVPALGVDSTPRR